MAILASLLGETGCLKGGGGAVPPAWPSHVEGVVCSNDNCISHTEARHVTSKFCLASRLPLRVSCAYCSHEILFGVVGCSTSRNYHLADSRDLRKIRPDHMVFFRDAAHAESAGFQPAARVGSAG
jgi:hypothetical protein